MKLASKWAALSALALVIGCNGSRSDTEREMTASSAETLDPATDPFGEQAPVDLGSVQQALSFVSLPACGLSTEGAVYYVHSPAARVGFYYCRSGTWRLVSAGGGPAGPAGAMGATGPQGATGAPGATGAIGPRGITGPQGGGSSLAFEQVVRVSVVGGCRHVDIGLDDNRNGQLDTGEVDTSGDVCDGPVGATGATGRSGLTGATGPVGSAGPRGLTGTTGATGAPGPTGPRGATGPAGIAGATGTAGSRGPTGLTGPRGATGPTGPRAGTGPAQDDCRACAMSSCSAQAAAVYGTNDAEATRLLECVVGADVSQNTVIPATSCFFADLNQPQGSFVPCYCGNTPAGVCLATGPSDPSQACASEIITASHCSPATASCVTGSGSDPRTPLGRVLQLVNCERAACGPRCGFPVLEDDEPSGVCGNGVLEAGEQCDLGAANGGSACSSGCTVPGTGEPTNCVECARTRCSTQYENARGTNSTAQNTALVDQLFACVIGPDHASGSPIPASSCFWDDPLQPLGSLLPCYCGSTPTATCLATGPAQPSEACGNEINLASGCNPLSASCVTGSGSNPNTALGDALLLLNCERAACDQLCGFPPIDDEEQPPPQRCGDGIVQPGEACDLGAANGGPDCSVSCLQPGAAGACFACAEQRCGTQVSAAVGANSSASNRAAVSNLLDCVIGADFELGSPIPPTSCFFADPSQPLGSLVGCYCGTTPTAVCLSSGPLVPSEACAAQVTAASGCNPALVSCVTNSASDPATALGDTLQLLNCERAACGPECGFPSD